MELSSQVTALSSQVATNDCVQTRRGLLLVATAGQEVTTLVTLPVLRTRMDVEIEYCVPCGFRDRAVEVQETVLNGLEQELDSVSLVMGDHGVFRVSADGEVVYDKDEDGGLDGDDIVRDLRERA